MFEVLGDLAGGLAVAVEIEADGVVDVLAGRVDEEDLVGHFGVVVEEGVEVIGGHGQDEVGLADEGGGGELAGVSGEGGAIGLDGLDGVGGGGHAADGRQTGGADDEAMAFEVSGRAAQAVGEHDLQEGFGHGTAAGVAGADEEDVGGGPAADGGFVHSPLAVKFDPIVGETDDGWSGRRGWGGRGLEEQVTLAELGPRAGGTGDLDSSGEDERTSDPLHDLPGDGVAGAAESGGFGIADGGLDAGIEGVVEAGSGAGGEQESQWSGPAAADEALGEGRDGRADPVGQFGGGQEGELADWALEVVDPSELSEASHGVGLESGGGEGLAGLGREGDEASPGQDFDRLLNDVVVVERGVQENSGGVGTGGDGGVRHRSGAGVARVDGSRERSSPPEAAQGRGERAKGSC